MPSCSGSTLAASRFVLYFGSSCSILLLDDIAFFLTDFNGNMVHACGVVEAEGHPLTGSLRKKLEPD